MLRAARHYRSHNLHKSLTLLLVLFYLGFHALSGERGLYAWFKESRRLEALKAELADIQAERAELDGRVRALSSNSLDLDMLDEQARKVLGYAAPDEVVVNIH